jgi:hypothetical protein
MEKVYPDVKYWGNPPKDRVWIPSPDELALPYLGKTVWLKKVRCDSNRFFYEIKTSDQIFVEPDWIDHFESDYLVPPADWKDKSDESRTDDLWLDPYKDRFIILDEIIIITGI